MMRTYEGYFRNGRFVSDEMIEIPENEKVYLMITGEQIQLPKTKKNKSNTGKRPISELKGLLENKVWIPADFNDPIEEMKEYME